MKTMLLSEAIDRGLADPNFSEDRDVWLARDLIRYENPAAICGCAGGAAVAGAGFKVTDLDHLMVAGLDGAYDTKGWAMALATLLDIPSAIVAEMSDQHDKKRIPASEIAEWVRREYPNLLVQGAGEAPS